MFDPSAKPRVFALPPGCDFGVELIRGMETRLAGQPPEAWARVEIIVNTRRMQRRLTDLFTLGPPRLLPRIRLITDLAQGSTAAILTPPVSNLRRRLELSQLISGLLDHQPDLAPRAAIYDLADS
ncbi:MAG: double-strand break repair protein AddB, partial [Paracoccaceae bacterium]|nr:double-strand break repair protein AddB [Paracoccaceae bacterium]